MKKFNKIKIFEFIATILYVLWVIAIAFTVWVLASIVICSVFALFTA